MKIKRMLPFAMATFLLLLWPAIVPAATSDDCERLVSLPDDIETLGVYMGGVFRELTIHFDTYDPVGGELVISTDNYYIRHYYQLHEITDLTMDCFQKANLYGDGTALTPLGAVEEPFTAVFDGGGFSIYDLKLVPEKDCALFSVNTGTIRM